MPAKLLTFVSEHSFRPLSNKYILKSEDAHANCTTFGLLVSNVSWLSDKAWGRPFKLNSSTISSLYFVGIDSSSSYMKHSDISLYLYVIEFMISNLLGIWSCRWIQILEKLWELHFETIRKEKTLLITLASGDRQYRPANRVWQMMSLNPNWTMAWCK